MSTTLLDIMEGRALRDAGIASAEITSAEWSERADRAILHLASLGTEFSADDVRDLVGDPPDHHAFGGVFLRNTRRKVIEPVGWVQSRRPSCHAHTGRSYRGVEAS